MKKYILEEELEKIQESSSDNSQFALLSQEIETQKVKNDTLASENDRVREHQS